MNELYTVLEFNQASGHHGDDQHVTFFDTLDEAKDHAADMTDENRQMGRRETYRVFELVEVGA